MLPRRRRLTGLLRPSTVTTHGNAFFHGPSLAHVGADSVDAYSDVGNAIRVDAVDAACGSGSDDRGDGGAENHRIAFRVRPLPLGLDGIPPLFHDLSTDIRQTFRHLRKEMVLTGRLGWFRDC